MLTFHDLKLPDGWPIYCACDTGTYMSSSITTIDPDSGAALVLFENPNYRYVGGEIELLGLSNHEWARRHIDAYNHLRPNTSKIHLWVDTNTQFRAELLHYGLVLHGNSIKLELRVEITREYVQARDPRRFYLAPWLTVLPYEMEYATWPDQATTSGRFEREKRNDHTLDTVEHVLSRRPRTRTVIRQKSESFIDRFLRENRAPLAPGRGRDVHLGSN